MSEICQYRGYEIVPRREWSQWCVSVYPMRPRSTHPIAVYSEDIDAAKGRGRGRGQENHRLRPVPSRSIRLPCPAYGETARRTRRITQFATAGAGVLLGHAALVAGCGRGLSTTRVSFRRLRTAVQNM